MFWHIIPKNFPFLLNYVLAHIQPHPGSLIVKMKGSRQPRPVQGGTYERDGEGIFR